MNYFYLFFILLFSLSISKGMVSQNLGINQTTPPPAEPLSITGPDSVCINSNSAYVVDVATGCNPSWFLNGNVQLVGSNTFIPIFQQSGENLIYVEFTCDTITFVSDSLIIHVSDVPDNPSSIQGPDQVCEFISETYTTLVEQGQSCEWFVNGLLQATTDTFLVYQFQSSGEYIIGVRAVDSCGFSGVETKTVNVISEPSVYLGNDTTIIIGNSLLLDAGNPGSSFEWSTGDTSQTILVDQPGTYWVVVENICGVDSDTIVVDVITALHEADECVKVIFQAKYGYIKIIKGFEEVRSVQLLNLNGSKRKVLLPEREFYISEKGIYLLLLELDNGTIVSKKVMVL